MPHGQAGTFIGLLSKVNAPFPARALPFRMAPVPTVIDALAMIVPANVEPVPRVAELPTCQNTSWDEAPPVKMTLLFPGPAAVVSVETIWKMYTPLPLSVRFPVIPNDGWAL